MLLGLNSESILLGVTTCILFAITISSRKINKQEIVDDTPEGVIKSAIERMVQENLLIEEQKTQKNKSHSVRHKNNLFDDDYTTDHVYGFIPGNISYNDEDYHYYPDNDNHYSDDNNVITSPAYSFVPGNIFYNNNDTNP